MRYCISNKIIFLNLYSAKTKTTSMLFTEPRLVRVMQNFQYCLHQIQHETNEKQTLCMLLLLLSRAISVYAKLNNYLGAKRDKFQ